MKNTVVDPSVLHAGGHASTLAAAARALSKAAEAIAEAAKAMADASHAMNATIQIRSNNIGNGVSLEDTSQMNSIDGAWPLSSTVDGINVNGSVTARVPGNNTHESGGMDIAAQVQSENDGATVNQESTFRSGLYGLGAIAHTYPKLPWGHNYVQLDQQNDIISFTASMALQSSKTICVVRVPASLSLLADTLSDITKLGIIRPETENTNRAASIQHSLNKLRQAKTPTMLLLDCSLFLEASLTLAKPDCLVHWGLPSDRAGYVKQLLLLDPTVRSCLIVSSSSQTRKTMLEHGVVAYPKGTLEEYLGPDSLFQNARTWLDRRSVLSRDDHPGESFPAPTTNSPSPIDNNTSPPKRAVIITLPASPTLWNSGNSGTCPRIMEQDSPPPVCVLPEGLYYIVLEEPLDTIPLISYLALRMKKIICYLPTGRSGTAHQQLLQRITNTQTTYCPQSKAKTLKKVMASFGGAKHAILLRPIHDQWDSCLRKSHTGCLVYWGLPENIKDFSIRAKTKAEHTYLILTRTQQRVLLGQKPQSILDHPCTGLFNSESPNSVLQEMRHRTETALAHISDPPVRSDVYRARLSRLSSSS